MKYCADTWFLINLFERDNKARNLLKQVQTGKDWFFVSFVTYAETMKKLFQKGNSNDQINGFFHFISNTQKIRFIPPDTEIAKETAKISLSYGLPLIDSFVAATAKIMECEILLSGDSDFNILVKRKYLKVQSW